MAAFLAEKQKYEGAAFVIVYIFLYGLFLKRQLLLRLIRQIIYTTVWLVGKVWQAEILSGIWASGERGPCMIRGVPSKDHFRYENSA